MDPWKENTIHEAFSPGPNEPVETAFAQALAMAKSLGFDFCAYGIKTSVPVTRQKVRTYNNYPLEWQQAYQEHNYVVIDPTVAFCLRESTVLTWSAQRLGTDSTFGEHADSFGVSQGCSVGCRSSDGSFGMLTFARSKDEISPGEVKALNERLFWLANFVHSAASQTLVPEMVETTLNGLTKREVEILKWTAEGKTSPEIGRILGLTERTINFHIFNAARKLNTSNRTQTVVRAAMLGLFSN